MSHILFDCNAPAIGRVLNAGMESPNRVREPDLCHRWEEPLVYFPFNNSYAETTEGGRVFTPSGTISFVSTFGGLPIYLQIGPELGAPTYGSASVPHDAVINRPNGLSGSFTLRLYLKADNFPLGTTWVTRAVYKGNPATFDYHREDVDVPASGWSIEVGRGILPRAHFFMGGSPGVALDIADSQTLNFNRHHVVIVFDAGAQTVTSYVGGTQFAQESTAGAGLVSNSESLYLTNEAKGQETFFPFADVFSASYVQVDELGIWDYPWDADQVECDAGRGYTWP